MIRRGSCGRIYGCGDSILMYGFAIQDARLGHSNAFGRCMPEYIIKNYASGMRIVGLEVDLNRLLKGYIPQSIVDYGRLLHSVLGIRCDFYQAVSGADEDREPVIPSIGLIKSIKPEWTKEQCREALDKISKFSGFYEKEAEIDYEEVYDYEDTDEDSEKEYEEKEWSEKRMDRLLKLYAGRDYLLTGFDSDSGEENVPKGHIPFDPREFRKLTRSEETHS